jgi:hypothetical protein
MPRGRPTLGDRPMSATERSIRSQHRLREREQRYEAVLRDLLATAECGTIGPKFVAQKCREALGEPS